MQVVYQKVSRSPDRGLSCLPAEVHDCLAMPSYYSTDAICRLIVFRDRLCVLQCTPAHDSTEDHKRPFWELPMNPMMGLDGFIKVETPLRALVTSVPGPNASIVLSAEYAKSAGDTMQSTAETTL